MENLSALWNLAPFAAALVALVVIAALIARIWRARATRVPEPASPETAEEELDSSHIGFAPLAGSALQQAPADADAPPRGEDASSARR